MKRKVAKLRLSPNEEARVLREEHERRRKLRIQQVREQQRYIALQIRQAVEQKRQRELEQLEKQLRQDWERQQREKLDTLQRLYQESLQLLGQGHRSAKENEPDLAAIAKKEEENHTKAEERYREALRELKSQKLKHNERQNQFINARKKALQSERERSAKVASLPPPPSNLIQNIDSRKSHVVKKSDVSAFAATHYHMSESTVDREPDTEQLNAHEEAEVEGRRLQDLQREEQRRREEQLEKARLRGRQALRREQLVQDRERLLVELEHMQQTDLLRRRQQVSYMPPQIFQPLYQRQETREDFQREMEFAFEDMYTGERRVKGDLVVQLVPEPLPALSTDSQDQELDITQDEVTTQGTENTRHGAEQEAASTEQEVLAQEEPSRPPPRRALKKLLDRIRNQRSQWTGARSHAPAASSQTAFIDQIPERDTTIETGSLTSEEKEKQPPTELPEPQVLETTEQSTAADTRLPDVLTNRIQEFEDERKKREEELEREKQKQMVLLQELEEQKAELEQMLLEAQHEREHLKAAAATEVAVNQADVPVHDEEITSVASGQATELEPPAGEDDHTRRIREYQQRLLEQNRIHQRSVEVARQRLEEYQRALQIRYMTSLPLLPTVMPPGVSHPPQHSTLSVHLPPLQHPPTVVQSSIHRPQTSVEVPTRESDMLASPPCPTGSSLSSGIKVLQDEVESDLLCFRNQRPVCAWLTDKVMERVTEHLPERVRPSSLATEPLPNSVFTPCHSATISSQPTSDPIRAFSPTITDEAPLVPGYAAAQPGATLHGTLQVGSLSSSEDDMEKQRRELQEVQRRVLEQREAMVLQQKQQEEERRRQELEMEQMRLQKETLQALIQTDTQTVPEAKSEVLVSENISQTRLRLLASLLRAIEESSGGTLSHLEDPQEKDGSPQQHPCSSDESEHVAQTSFPAGPVPVSVLPSGHLPPPRAAKPPVTRVRLGIMELMTEQHELSAIQEVETPANVSQVAGPEESLAAPSHTVNWDPHEESDSSEPTNRTLQTPSESSSEHGTAERQSSSGTRRSKHVTLRERLMGADSSDSDSALRIISPLSSDSGRGADYSGPAITSYRSYTESPHRPPESDCLSSTTISTGSYITTDPEQIIDKSPAAGYCEEEGRGADLCHASSPSAQSSCMKEGSATAAVDSLFNDSSIQHIIDRYMRELNISLSTAGRTTDSEGSNVEEAGSSFSQQSQVQDSERSGEHEGSAGLSSLPSQTSGQPQERDSAVDPVHEHFSGGDLSQAEDPEQDSFRPLIGQLADQSSCLATDQRGSAMEHLVGQPSAHSSMIGHPPGLPVSVSLDQGGWDSTLSRMIGQLSHQSSFNWLSGGQDFYADQLMGQLVQEPSTTWLDDGQEESLMRPLVGELDNDQHSGSSGERTRIDLGVSTEACVPLYTALPPEASSHSSNIPTVSQHLEHQELHNRSGRMDSGPDRSEVFPGSDSFHPLLAEITHNETVDPSMTFHLLEHNMPTSPEGQPATGRRSVPSTHEESETHSDPSPERLRTEHAVHESCQGQPQESVLMLDDTVRTDVELTALNLSNFSMCDESPALELPQPAGMSAEANSISENLQLPGPFIDLYGEELKSEQGSNFRDELSVSDKILEGLSAKGILEQSEITLVSLTDTTLQDQEATITEEDPVQEDPVQEDKLPHRERGKGQTGQDREGSESTLLPEDMVKDKDQTDKVTLQKFEWEPSGGQQRVNQQKRTILLQRSARRVEAIKAKGALTRIKSGIQTSSETRGKSKAGKCQPVSRETKTEPEPQHENNHKLEGGRAEQQQTDRSGFKLKQVHLPPPVSDCRPKKMDVLKIHTPEQRKLDVSEMHQRTRRLYEQLEEVKHQKTIRSRQEAYAKNRLKAKEFHMKTLEKLRAKQTL